MLISAFILVIPTSLLLKKVLRDRFMELVQDMRIAFIGHKRIPSREGGVEIVVDELSSRMSARGNRVVVYNRKGHNVAGAEFDNTVNASDKPFSYQGVQVVPVTTIDAKGMAALSSSFFATLKAIAAKPDVIPLPCRRAVCDAPTGALGGNSYRCHYPWPRLAACQVGKVRLHVFEVRRTYRGQVRGRGHCAQPEHAGILQEHV